MTAKQNLESLWSSINVQQPGDCEEIFERNQDALLEFLIGKTLEKEKFEIGIFEDGRQKGAALSYSDSEQSKEIELRLKKNSSYELILTLEDDRDRFHFFKCKLGSYEIKLIPEQIKSLMYKVREIEMPMTFFNSLAE